MPPREVLFEFIQIGPVMKVVAIDPETGTEAVIQGPAHMPRSLLQKTAIKKLNYILTKQSRLPQK